MSITIWDAVLAIVCIACPAIWFDVIHDAPHIDPQALLARTGGVWAAFAAFHLVAVFRWQRHSVWLALVAGMRLSEVFADWIYLMAADDVTTFGRVALILATPVNVAVFALLFRSFVLHSRNRDDD